MSTDGLIGALILTLVPIWIATALLARLPRPLFWFACALIAVGVGYLIATGAAEDIGRNVKQWAIGQLDKERATAREVACLGGHVKALGTTLMLAPFLVPLGVFVVRLRHRPTLLTLVGASAGLLGALCFFLLAATPIPEKVARSIFPDDTLRVPRHCGQT